MSIESNAIDERNFDDPKVRRYLDALPVSDLLVDLGQPEEHERAMPPTGHWAVGTVKPALADVDPAVNAAMGKCAVARMRRQGMPGPSVDSFHPVECGWCDYPLKELLAALDWGLWHARFVTVSLYIWRQSQSGPGRYVIYARETGRSGYQAPDWEKFAARPQREQAKAVARVVTP